MFTSQQSNAISFLAGNNFDFNKVFNSGISFVRQSEAPRVHEQCTAKVTNSLGSDRYYSCLSTRTQELLDSYMHQIEEYVFNPKERERLVFTIHSKSLKKTLIKLFTSKYDKKAIFIETQLGLAETIVRKGKYFN